MSADAALPPCTHIEGCLQKVTDLMSASFHGSLAVQNLMSGYGKYMGDFVIPLAISSQYFQAAEQQKLLFGCPLDAFNSYQNLLTFNQDLSVRALWASMLALSEFVKAEGPLAVKAALDTLMGCNGQNLSTFCERLNQLSKGISGDLDKAVQEVEADFGFHFQREGHPQVAETDRFILYQVMPNEPGVQARADGKPVLIIPPFVLGANILGFLPNEKKSYAHCFANMGIPTYIRVMKNIQETVACQIMSAEDDVRDNRYFCERIRSRHGRPVTLNGYCQGGFSSVCNLLSGELDGLVDALITCVAPMDGTRSQGFKEFLGNLPARFNDLSYGVKILPSGNQVADGALMGWVYKLKSIENEFPVVAMFRDMAMFGYFGRRNISKTILAIKYWLMYERSDLPMSITRMSFASYNHPVAPDGTLPITLFGRKLNFNRIREKNIPWLICYGEKDDLVEKETALAPLDYVAAEVTPFPKGHVAIATSWAHPTSACALHTRYGEAGYRGPVRFHLDLEETEAAKAQTP